MTLGQLRTFLAVADTGSVRRAAERLVVAQPSVSAAVSSLERELGVPLVARHGRGLRLTPAGVVFAAAVGEALGLLEAGARGARATEAPGHGEVRVAAVTTAAERLLPPLVARFKRRFPASRVTITVGNRAAVWEALSRHEADLVVAGRPPEGLAARTVATAENALVVVGAPEQAGRPAAASTFLMREAGSGTREAAEELLSALDRRPETMILGSNGAIAEAAAAGLGVALCSLGAVEAALEAGSLVRLAWPGTPLERPWHLVNHGREALGATVALLVEAMSEEGPFRLTADGEAQLEAVRRTIAVRQPF